jgi:hypothetical protein
LASVGVSIIAVLAAGLGLVVLNRSNVVSTGRRPGSAVFVTGSSMISLVAMTIVVSDTEAYSVAEKVLLSAALATLASGLSTTFIAIYLWTIDNTSIGRANSALLGLSGPIAKTNDGRPMRWLTAFFVPRESNE